MTPIDSVYFSALIYVTTISQKETEHLRTLGTKWHHSKLCVRLCVGVCVRVCLTISCFVCSLAISINHRAGIPCGQTNTRINTVPGE